MIVVFAAIATAITAVIMRSAPPALGFRPTFKLAYPAWFGAFAAMILAYAFYPNVLHRPVADTPSLLILGILVGGGWGATHLVRIGRRKVLQGSGTTPAAE